MNNRELDQRVRVTEAVESKNIFVVVECVGVLVTMLGACDLPVLDIVIAGVDGGLDVGAEVGYRHVVVAVERRANIPIVRDDAFGQLVGDGEGDCGGEDMEGEEGGDEDGLGTG